MDYIKLISTNVAVGLNCTAEIEFQGTDSSALPVVNTKTEAENVTRVASKIFGAQRVTGEGTPVPGSEDFSFYGKHAPSAFLFLGTMQPGSQPIMPHTNFYDFNDSMIPSGAVLWVRLVEDRFGVNIF